MTYGVGDGNVTGCFCRDEEWSVSPVMLPLIYETPGSSYSRHQWDGIFNDTLSFGEYYNGVSEIQVTLWNGRTYQTIPSSHPTCNPVTGTPDGNTNEYNCAAYNLPLSTSTFQLLPDAVYRFRVIPYNARFRGAGTLSETVIRAIGEGPEPPPRDEACRSSRHGHKDSVCVVLVRQLC